jgi:hypothetical protein
VGCGAGGRLAVKPGSLGQTRPRATTAQELVGRKLELAQLAEREVIARRELYKAKEANLRLASKLTKMEAAVYTARR